MKLVANKLIQQIINNITDNTWIAQKKSLATPTKYIVGATNVLSLPPRITSTLEHFSIVSAQILPNLVLNFIIYKQSGSVNSATLEVSKGTVIIEYFVPA